MQAARLGFPIGTASRAALTNLAVNLVAAGYTRLMTEIIRDRFYIYKKGQIAVERTF